MLGGLNGRYHDCVTSRGNVGLCLYQSLIKIFFVVCETVTHVRRCGGNRLVPRGITIKLYVVSSLSWLGSPRGWGGKAPLLHFETPLRKSTLLLFPVRWLARLCDFCLRERASHVPTTRVRGWSNKATSDDKTDHFPTSLRLKSHSF